jgi:RNA polymerase sigma-70 factor (ECF subfamily)
MPPKGQRSPIFQLWTGTDEEAMRRVQTADDHQAFARLMARWQEPIYRLCARMTGDLHLGQDLAQEAFMRIYSKRHTYQPGSRVSTWMWRIALNLCYDELRRRQRRENSGNEPDDLKGDSQPENAMPGPTPDQRLDHQEQSALVRQALLQLPETLRSVVILRHYENLKFREIANLLEVPEGTVKSRMAEALGRLNRLLSPSFPDLPRPSYSVKTTPKMKTQSTL